MKATHAVISIILAGAVLGAANGWAQSDHHTLVKSGELKWVNVGSLPPGAKLAVIEGPLNEAKLITARIMLPANYQIPPHWHTGVERVTVLSGTFNIGMGDKLDMKKTTALGPGDMAIMQPKMTHFVWTDRETVVQLNTMGPWTLTYVNPADDPRKK